jgi:hypothetical protein
MTLSFLTGAGIGILALMFLPVLIALLRRRFLVAVVALAIVLVSIPALIHPLFGMLLWLVALCVGSFAGARKVLVIERRR